MKSTHILIGFILSILLLGTAYAGDDWTVRFIDSATLKPIAETAIQFIPRRGGGRMPDANVPPSESFTTDSTGRLKLTETDLIRLTGSWKVPVDIHCPSHANCYLWWDAPDVQQNVQQNNITVFRLSNRAAAVILLSLTDPNVIPLDPVVPK